VEGGGAVISGVAAGVTGVITKPVEGALKHGSTGFVRGVAIGAMGAVINPVLGLADGLNSFAQTILVQTSDLRLRPQVRLPSLAPSRPFFSPCERAAHPFHACLLLSCPCPPLPPRSS